MEFFTKKTVEYQRFNFKMGILMGIFREFYLIIRKLNTSMFFLILQFLILLHSFYS